MTGTKDGGTKNVGIKGTYKRGSFLHQYFFSSKGVAEPLRASYLDQPDFDWNNPANVNGCFAENKKPFLFSLRPSQNPKATN